MLDLLRQEIFTEARTLVIKVGTRVLTDARGHLNQERIESLASQIARGYIRGHRIVLVSSGAVGAGMGRLGLGARPTSLSQLQAVAAVGQSALIEAYNRYFELRGMHAAQILLTADDLDLRATYLNIRNTIHALLEFGTVPIINENDTISVTELQTTFGDNDHLAALVANLIHAPLLILLSDVDGFMNGDPHDVNSKVIPTVHKLDAELLQLVCDSHSGLSKGGMASKLRVAHQVTSAGGSVIIANGGTENILERLFSYESDGTLFLPQGMGIAARKQWIGYAVMPRGSVVVDEGARRAVETQGRSLLPVGVLRVVGEFEHGDLVAVVDSNGEEFARGLTNYASRDLWKIRGLHTQEIPQALDGNSPYEEVIHRDNLAVTNLG